MCLRVEDGDVVALHTAIADHVEGRSQSPAMPLPMIQALRGSAGSAQHRAVAHIGAHHGRAEAGYRGLLLCQ